MAAASVVSIGWPESDSTLFPQSPAQSGHCRLRTDEYSQSTGAQFPALVNAGSGSLPPDPVRSNQPASSLMKHEKTVAPRNEPWVREWPQRPPASVHCLSDSGRHLPDPVCRPSPYLAGETELPRKGARHTIGRDPPSSRRYLALPAARAGCRSPDPTVCESKTGRWHDRESHLQSLRSLRLPCSWLQS